MGDAAAGGRRGLDGWGRLVKSIHVSISVTGGGSLAEVEIFDDNSSDKHIVCGPPTADHGATMKRALEDTAERIDTGSWPPRRADTLQG